MKIVHAADLHIDSPLRGLDRYDGAPVEKLRGATRRALENLVQLCIDEDAALLVLAGDVFDGTWKDYSTGLFFAAQMSRLNEAKIPVVIVRGNHDALSSVVKALRLPDNVHELNAKKPETKLVGGRIAVHGQSFEKKTATEDLAARYPDRVPGLFNVGLLHTSIDGREGHEPYAPTSLETMRAKGYDYWALGHVHAREIVSKDPWIVYSGNLQGRHARETGAKGATVLTVEGNVVEELEHRALDVVRWEHVSVDVTEATDLAGVLDLARDALKAATSDGRILAARITIHGRTAASSAIRQDIDRLTSELRALATDLGDVWIEKIFVETHAPLDLPRIREEASAVGHLARRIQEIRDNDAELAALLDVFAELDKKLPAELRDGEGLRLGDPAFLRRLMEDVEELLVPRLLEGTEE